MPLLPHQVLRELVLKELVLRKLVLRVLDLAILLRARWVAELRAAPMPVLIPDVMPALMAEFVLMLAQLLMPE
mgnify:FL=1